MNIESIHNEATEAARQASQAAFDKLGQDCFPCGFAWVKILGVKLSTRDGRTFKEIGFRKDYYGGISLYNPGGMFVQNVDVKEAGAEAYAEVLRKYGYDAYSQSRLD